MARKLRLEFPGAIYHVINRGDRREPISQDVRDRTRFVETLGEDCAKADGQVHAYCLMANHFHLVVAAAKAKRLLNEQLQHQRLARRQNLTAEFAA